MPRDGAKLLGVKALDGAFEELTRGLRNQAGRKATRQVAKEIILPEALHRVRRLSGKLARSLTVRAAKLSRRTKKDTVGASVRTRDGWFVGDEFYGGFIEFGWLHWRNQMPIGPFSFLADVIYNNAIRIRCAQRFAQLYREYVRTVRLKAADKAIADANRSFRSIRNAKADRVLNKLF